MTAPEELSPQAAAARLAGFQVVDVRAEHEFHGPLGRIAGALLAPLPELDARAATLPKGRPLLVVCRSGARSARACAQLAAMGLGPALNLTGGMIAWNRAGLPVERSAPASLAALLDGVVAWLAQVGGGAPGAAREAIGGALARAGASFERPTAAAVGSALDAVERSFAGREPPADLELALAAFRRSLATL
jgi:rhodanese-related sulfurtransferase